MKINFRRSLAALAIGGATLCLSGSTGQAQTRRDHPGYLQALGDLRQAHSILEQHPGGGSAQESEKLAMREIEAAIGRIDKAAADDGKDMNYHMGEDLPHDHAGQLRRAHDLLEKAHQEVEREEDDPKAQDMRHLALGHIDAAAHATEKALEDSHRP